MVSAHLRYSDKPFMGSVTSVERAEDSIEMARIVFGREFVDQNCVILANINANSPPRFRRPALSRSRLPETMVGCALTQLARPGAPTVFGNFLSSTDLRTGSPTFGTPESALGSLVVGQLARRLGLPLRCSGAFTSSKVADGKAMTESAVAMQATVQCGANFILHSAGWLERGLTKVFEKLILDADFCSALHVYMAGLSVNPNQLALGAFREVAPGKHFFAEGTPSLTTEQRSGNRKSLTTPALSSGVTAGKRMPCYAPTRGGRSCLPITRPLLSTQPSTTR